MNRAGFKSISKSANGKSFCLSAWPKDKYVWHICYYCNNFEPLIVKTLADRRKMFQKLVRILFAKYLLTLFLTMFWLVFPLSGQTGFRLGVSVDPLITWFSPKSTQVDRDGARPGINGGLITEVYFAPNYGFVSGLSLMTIGGNLTYNQEETVRIGEGVDRVLPSGTTLAYRLTYLSIPVGIKMKTTEIGYFTYYAQLGFTPQLNIGSRATSDDDQFRRETISDEVNLFHLSYFFGGGLEYSLGGQTSLLAGVYFNNGFIDVLSNNDHKSTVNFFTFRIGMLF